MMFGNAWRDGYLITQGVARLEDQSLRACHPAKAHASGHDIPPRAFFLKLIGFIMSPCILQYETTGRLRGLASIRLKGSVLALADSQNRKRSLPFTGPALKSEIPFACKRISQIIIWERTSIVRITALFWFRIFFTKLLSVFAAQAKSWSEINFLFLGENPQNSERKGTKILITALLIYG